jgi:hypothetical protein
MVDLRSWKGSEAKSCPLFEELDCLFIRSFVAKQFVVSIGFFLTFLCYLIRYRSTAQYHFLSRAAGGFRRCNAASAASALVCGLIEGGGNHERLTALSCCC